MAFALSKDANPLGVVLFRLVEHFGPTLNGGWEAASITALKLRINKKAWQIPFDDPLPLQLGQGAVCAQNDYWRSTIRH